MRVTGQDIKREIEMLSPGEVSESQAWLNQQEQYEATVERQLKTAEDAGEFDKPIKEAIADEKDGLTSPL
jgi:hypothetical protein